MLKCIHVSKTGISRKGILSYFPHVFQTTDNWGYGAVGRDTESKILLTRGNENRRFILGEVYAIAVCFIGKAILLAGNGMLFGDNGVADLYKLACLIFKVLILGKYDAFV